MEKEETFRRQVKLTQIKLNLPIREMNNEKKAKALKQKILTRKSIWLVYSSKLDNSIKKTVEIMNGKIAEIDQRMLLLAKGEDVDPFHNEHTEVLLAKQYELEIDKLKEIITQEKCSEDELKHKNGVLSVLMDKLKFLMNIIGIHK